jgi:hypothetical protein
MRNEYKNFGQKTQREQTTLEPGHRWEHINKTDLRETGCEDVD